MLGTLGEPTDSPVRDTSDGRTGRRRAAVSDPVATVPCMIIDCGQCAVRGDACTDCVVTFLTIPVGAPGSAPWDVGPGVPDLDEAEQGALAVLAGSGLVPPLRMRAV